jgi:hypothetical protein
MSNIKEAIELYLDAEPEDCHLPTEQYKVCELAL